MELAQTGARFFGRLFSSKKWLPQNEIPCDRERLPILLTHVSKIGLDRDERFRDKSHLEFAGGGSVVGTDGLKNIDAATHYQNRQGRAGR